MAAPCTDCRDSGWIEGKAAGGWVVERARFCHCPAGPALKASFKAKSEEEDDEEPEPTTFADHQAEHHYTLYGSFGEPYWAA